MTWLKVMGLDALVEQEMACRVSQLLQVQLSKDEQSIVVEIRSKKHQSQRVGCKRQE